MSLSRRSFLRSTAVGVGAALAGPLARPSFSEAGWIRLAGQGAAPDEWTGRLPTRSLGASVLHVFRIATSTSRSSAPAPTARRTRPRRSGGPSALVMTPVAGASSCRPGDSRPARSTSRVGVNLHVTEQATLLFSRDPRAYLPVVFTRWEGVELMNYSPLIYAFGERDSPSPARARSTARPVADHWWPWKGGASKVTGQPDQLPDRAELMKLSAAGAPVERRIFGGGHYLRPQLHPAVSLPERAHRRRPHRELADVGDPSGALHERHRARRDDRDARPEQRRLQSRILLGRADRALHLRHR